MAEQPGTSVDPERRRPPAGTPRWVKVFGIVAGVLILSIVVLHLSGGFMNHVH